MLVFTGLRTRTAAGHPGARTGALSGEINVIIETSDAPDALHVLTEEALNDVTLKLKLKGWFTTNQTLVSTSLWHAGCHP